MDTKFATISFESFLAKIQDYQALETYVYTYADSQVDNVSCGTTRVYMWHAEAKGFFDVPGAYLFGE